jgi:hypothetical protein
MVIETNQTIQKDKDPVDALEQLKEVFPTISEDLIMAVWEANDGHLDPSFRTLFQMANPSVDTTAEDSERLLLKRDEELAYQLQYMEKKRIEEKDGGIIDDIYQDMEKLKPAIQEKMALLKAGCSSAWKKCKDKVQEWVNDQPNEPKNRGDTEQAEKQ